MIRRAFAGLLGAALVCLCACSPVYVMKSAAGEARLLWRRKSIAKAVADPKTPPKLREELSLVQDIRAFAFDEVHLKRSRDYSTYAAWPGPYLTYLVTASPKLRLEPKIWSFPLAGSFPYKGFFKKEDALREKARLEAQGLDVYVRGVASYNTPLPFSDPVPTTVLDEPPGDLADLIIHELTHGTVYYKSRGSFDEGVASFVGDEGARQFLAKRFGPGSPELAAFEKGLADQRSFDRRMDALRRELDALYSGPGSEQEKLKEREAVFARAAAGLAKLGYRVGALNNAVVVAQGVYREDNAVFRQAYEKQGGDWGKTIALFKSLDKRRPLEDLRSRLGAS